MHELAAYAEAKAGELQEELTSRGNRARATADIRSANPPCILVVPSPRRDSPTLSGGFAATWSVYCIAPGVGDLTDAKTTEELADVVTTVVGDVSVIEPVSIVLPGSGPEGKPALRCEFTTDVTP